MAKKATSSEGKKRINISESLRIARDPYFEYDREEDLGEFTAGACAEGHSAQYVFVFVNSRTGEEVMLGSVCQFKPFLFRKWPNLKEEDLYDATGHFDKAFLSIGKNLWKIKKDHLEPELADAEKSLGYSVDISRVPPKEKRAEIASQFSRLVGKAIAIRKARIKAEKERKAREAKLAAYRKAGRSSLYASRSEELAREKASKDELYQKFKAVRFQSPKAEAERNSMLAGYVKYGGSWLPQQRKKVETMLRVEPKVGETKPAAAARPSTPAVSGMMNALLITVKEAQKNPKTSNLSNFLQKMERNLPYNTAAKPSISTKERAFLSRILFTILKVTNEDMKKFVDNLPAYPSRT